MRASLSRGLALAVALIVVVAFVVLWRACRSTDHGPPPSPVGFSTDQVTLVSPDLDLDLVEVRGRVNPGYTDWSCILTCRESGGCRAAVRVRILYLSAGEERTLTVDGRFDANAGEKMRIGRMQRPPVVVDRVESVTVEVAARYTPGAPRPTPVQ